MFAGATAARLLAPTVASLLVALYYKYYQSGAKTKVSDHTSPHPTGGGAPPHLQDDRAPPDLDPAVVDAILNLAHLNANRNFKNPAVLDEIRNLIRNFDPADDIVGKVEKLCLEENKPGEQEPACTDGGPSSSTETESPTIVQRGRLGEQEQACTDGPSSSTETESPTTVQGTRLDHAPSDLDPATLDQIRRLDPGVVDEMLKLGPLILDRIRNRKAGSFPPGECWTYLKTGTCKNRSNCKFKHPPRSKDKQVSNDKEKKKEELAEKPGRAESKVSKNKGKKMEELAEKPGQTESKVSKDKAKEKAAKKPGRTESKVSKDKAKEKEAVKPGRSESKNDFRSEGHKSAKVRTSNHSRGQHSVAPAGENFLGLPIRPGEKKCRYYMQNGSCKYGLNCKYNHPDPKAARESHPVSRYGNGGPATFQGASPSTVEPSSARRSLNKTPRYVPPMVIPPSEWSPYTELNSYQVFDN